MCLDECPPGDARRTICAMRSGARSTGPSAAGPPIGATDQALFAIVQGGTDLELRGRCAGADGDSISPATPWAASASANRRPQMHAAPDAHGRSCCPTTSRVTSWASAGRRTSWRASPPASTCSTASCRPATAAMPWPSPPAGRSGCAMPATSEIRRPLESGCPCYDVPEFQPGLPAPPVPGRGDAGTDAAVAAQRRFLLPADGGGPAGDPGRTVRGVPRGQPCPLGSRRLKYPFCPFTEGLGDNSRNDARARRAKIRQASANPL